MRIKVILILFLLVFSFSQVQADFFNDVNRVFQYDLNFLQANFVTDFFSSSWQTVKKFVSAPFSSRTQTVLPKTLSVEDLQKIEKSLEENQEKLNLTNQELQDLKNQFSSFKQQPVTVSEVIKEVSRIVQPASPSQGGREKVVRVEKIIEKEIIPEATLANLNAQLSNLGIRLTATESRLALTPAPQIIYTPTTTAIVNSFGVLNVDQLYVSTETFIKKLTLIGDGSVAGNFSVTGNATIAGNTTISGSLIVTGSQTFSGAQTITANSAGTAFTVNQTGAGAIFDLQKSGSSKVFVDTNGNVGIGTTSPQSKLDVVASPLVGPQGFITQAGGLQVNYGRNMGTASFGFTDYDLDKPILTLRTPNGLLGTNAGIQTALLIQAEAWGSNTGVAIEMGHTGQSSRIISYGNNQFTTGSKLQLQSHSNSTGIWNTGIMINEEGNVGIGTVTDLDRPLVIQGASGASAVIKFTDTTSPKSWHIGTLNDNDFSITETSVAERITVKAGGNVGIGATNKLSKLTIVGSADETNIGGTTTASASTTIVGVGTAFLSKLGIGDRISLSSAASTYATVTAIASDTSLTVDIALGNGTSQTINAKHSSFRVENSANAVQMVVNDQGNVGIGTTGPNILGYSAGNRVLTIVSDPAIANQRGVLELVDSNVTGTSSAIGSIDFLGSNITSERLARISVTGDGALDSAQIGLWTRPTGGPTTERFRITSTGNIGIGTTSPLLKLDVAGSGRFTGAATSVLTGSIDAIASTAVTGVGTLFTTELVVGDRITVTGETRTVTVIATNTTLTVDTAFTDTANDISPDKLAAIFVARDSASAVKMIINDLGNVGIGTAGPGQPLHLQALATNVKLRIANSTPGGAAQTSELILANMDNGAVFYDGGQIKSIQTEGVSSIARSDLAFFTGQTWNGIDYGTPSERLRITSLGSVGIGTTSPQEKLTLASASNFATEMAVPTIGTVTCSTTGGSLGGGVSYFFKVTASDNATATTSTTGSAEGSCAMAATTTGSVAVNYTAPTGAAGFRIYKGIAAAGEDRFQVSTSQTTFTYTTDTGATLGSVPTTTNAYVNKLTASGNSWLLGGNVGIGTATPGAQLDLSTDSARKLTTTTWATGSDIRIKTNVESISNALDIIGRVRPVKFNYTSEFLAAHPSAKDIDYYNFIAQEYQQVFPDSVTETDGLLYLNSSNMIPYAIAGIKELDAKLALLSSKLDSEISSPSTSLGTSAWFIDQASGRIKTSLLGDFDFENRTLNNVRALFSTNWSIDENGKIIAKKVVTDELELAGNCIKVVDGSLKATAGSCLQPQTTQEQTPPAPATEPEPEPTPAQVQEEIPTMEVEPR